MMVVLYDTTCTFVRRECRVRLPKKNAARKMKILNNVCKRLCFDEK